MVCGHAVSEKLKSHESFNYLHLPDWEGRHILSAMHMREIEGIYVACNVCTVVNTSFSIQFNSILFTHNLFQQGKRVSIG